MKNSAIAPACLPNIAELITYGEITVGVLRPVGCVATATDGHNCLAMLVRRRRETLAQFLTRLDRAINQALTEEIYTDEINAPNRPLLAASVHITFSWILTPTLLSTRQGPDAYRVCDLIPSSTLREQVLRRDGWRCQCGPGLIWRFTTKNFAVKVAVIPSRI